MPDFQVISPFAPQGDQPQAIDKLARGVLEGKKFQNLMGVTLLLVQPLTPDRQPAGRPIVAADAMGAGVGEEVFFVRGKEASFPFYPLEAPVDAGIVGIVDHWSLD